MRNITLFSAWFKDVYPFDILLRAKESYLVDHNQVLNLAKPNPKNSLLIFWGGADIHPSLYGKKHSVFSGASKEVSYRDSYESKLYRQAVDLGIPVLGICRGAQLVTALNGGELIQHVSNHGMDHRMTTIDGTTMAITSTHHQMMLPNEDGELIGWSSVKRSSTYMGEGTNKIRKCYSDDFKEPEIVYYPKTNTLAVQGHPEYMTPVEDFPQYVTKLIKEKLNVGAA